MGELCVITARGGSKRIPHKNIKNFLGKPIIAYSIETALESRLFDEVMVSTDDELIADVARSFGASVPFMRNEFASDDYATTATVLLEVLDEYTHRNESYERLCCIYPTAPFVTTSKLLQAREILNTYPSCPSVLTATAFSFPPQRGLVEHDGLVDWWDPECRNWRSQDLPTIYHDVGQLYYLDAAAFLRTGNLVMKGTRMLIVPETEAQDIDNETDWDLAEMKYERMMSRERS